MGPCLTDRTNRSIPKPKAFAAAPYSTHSTRHSAKPRVQLRPAATPARPPEIRSAARINHRPQCSADHPPGRPIQARGDSGRPSVCAPIRCPRQVRATPRARLRWAVQGERVQRTSRRRPDRRERRRALRRVERDGAVHLAAPPPAASSREPRKSMRGRTAVLCYGAGDGGRGQRRASGL